MHIHRSDGTKKMCWKTSVRTKLYNNEQAIMAMTRHNSWTGLSVCKYNSSKINTEVNKLQQELPDEIAKNPKHSQNPQHAKKATCQHNQKVYWKIS